MPCRKHELRKPFPTKGDDSFGIQASTFLVSKTGDQAVTQLIAEIKNNRPTQVKIAPSSIKGSAMGTLQNAGSYLSSSMFSRPISAAWVLLLMDTLSPCLFAMKELQ